MPIVWNTTKEEVVTKMQGAWFKFKPDQKKRMDEDKCRFISELRKETGLMVLPSEFDAEADGYIEGYENTAEGKSKLEELRIAGVNNLLEHHRSVIRNNQVSLRKDMARTNPVGDSDRLVMTEMSPGEVKSLEIVARYQRAKQDDGDAKVKEIQKLLDAAGPIGE